MEICKFIAICAFYTIIRFHLVLNLPTFGSESVYIKLHIPDETASARNRITSKHSFKTRIPHQNVHHKIIHRYHRHRRPSKRLPIKQTVPLLENIILAELDRPQTQYIEDLYDGNGKENINTFKFPTEYKYPIHTNVGKKRPKIKNVIENDNNVQQHEGQYHHNVFVEDEPKYTRNYQQEKHKEYNYQLPEEEVIKVIEAPINVASVKDESNYRYQGFEGELLEEEKQNHDFHSLQEQANIKYENNYQTQYDYHPLKEGTFSKSPVEYHTYRISKPVLRPYTPNLNSDEEKSNQKEHNAANERLLPFIGYSTHTNEDDSNFPEDEENAHAAETYNGYDSYSAAHVQGLGSGTYCYDATY